MRSQTACGQARDGTFSEAAESKRGLKGPDRHQRQANWPAGSSLMAPLTAGLRRFHLLNELKAVKERSEGRRRVGRSDNAPDCPCQNEIHAPHQAGRRGLLLGAGSLASAGAIMAARHAAAAPAGSIDFDVAADPTKEQGRATGADGGYGSRSQFEKSVRTLADNPSPQTSWTLTPLADMPGNLTPSGLHYERHHAGIPTIDPARHTLVVHGLVDAPKRFTMADIRRMPSTTRRHFIECSGNTLTEWAGPKAKTVQASHGLLSTSDWTGVRFSEFARQVGIKPEGEWVVAGGADGAAMTRSIPMEKMLRDGMIAYGQNGEAIRPEQGYPIRLLLPGYEGNTHIKWLQSLQVNDVPAMSREETSKYTDLMPDGRAWKFVFEMDAKSVITFPSAGQTLPAPGAYEITGLAWSGRGRIAGVEVSIDGGSSWQLAELDGTADSICTVRFRLPWRWDGTSATVLSRCRDETGYNQPTRKQLVGERGLNAVYHYNAIQAWVVGADGSVTNAPA